MIGRVLGIDPGKKGGVAALDQDGRLIEVIPMPDIQLFCMFLAKHSPFHVYIEMAHARPGNASGSSFRYGVHYGELLGAMTALGFAYTPITPSKWMRAAHTGTVKAETKARSDQVARRLWPKTDWRATGRCRKNHDGMQEAALVAFAGLALSRGEHGTGTENEEAP